VNLAGFALAFVLQIVLARTLTVEGYGAYTYALSWVIVLSLPATFGFDNLILREVPDALKWADLGRLKGIVVFSHRIGLLLGSVLGLLLIVVALAAFQAEPLLLKLFIYGGVLLPIWALTLLRQSVLRALKRAALSRFPEMVIRPLIILLLLGCLWGVSIEIDAVWVIFLMFVASLIAYGIGKRLQYRALPEGFDSFEPEFQRKAWLKAGALFLFVSGTHVLLNEIDKVMLGYLTGMEGVARYSVAFRIAALSLFAQQSVNTIAAPLIAEAYASKSKEELQRTVSSAALLTASASVLIVLVLALSGEWVLGLFGAEYIASFSALMILMLGNVVNFACGPVGYLLIMTGHEKDQAKILFVSMVLNILLNIPAIIYGGFIGAAIVTASITGSRNIVAWWIARRRLGVNASILGMVFAQKEAR
jgi:O-antigen/teichoic acid export membrane protein